jgi:hypothetical protein
MTPDLFNAVLAPMNLLVRDVLDVNGLSYDYAAAQTVLPVRGG